MNAWGLSATLTINTRVSGSAVLRTQLTARIDAGLESTAIRMRRMVGKASSRAWD
jgi:hypothetical protein